MAVKLVEREGGGWSTSQVMVKVVRGSVHSSNQKTFRTHSKTLLILVATNARDGSSEVIRVRELVKKIHSTSVGLKNIGILSTVDRTNSKILELLQNNHESIAIFHFEGRPNHYESLLAFGTSNSPNQLIAILKNLLSLRLIFLNGCSETRFINELVALGVPAIISASKQLSNQTLTSFSRILYEELINGSSLSTAFENAKVVHNSGVQLWGDSGAREWRLVKLDD